MLFSSLATNYRLQGQWENREEELKTLKKKRDAFHAISDDETWLHSTLDAIRKSNRAEVGILASEIKIITEKVQKKH